MNKKQMNLFGIFNKRSLAGQWDFKRYELISERCNPQDIGTEYLIAFRKSATKAKFKSLTHAETVRAFLSRLNILPRSKM